MNMKRCGCQNLRTNQTAAFAGGALPHGFRFYGFVVWASRTEVEGWAEQLRYWAILIAFACRVCSSLKKKCTPSV